jgi:hypothetical protein
MEEPLCSRQRSWFMAVPSLLSHNVTALVAMVGAAFFDSWVAEKPHEQPGVDVVLTMTSDSLKVRYKNSILIDGGSSPVGSTIEKEVPQWGAYILSSKHPDYGRIEH